MPVSKSRDMISTGGDRMKDIPLFTTEFGVADLILKEVPYREAAYIRIHAVQEGGIVPLLDECRKFCAMVGAEHIYASGHELPAAFPRYTSVLELQGTAQADSEKTANLFPVTEETVSKWRGIYNERMRNVDNAATLESRDEQKIVSSGGAYFVHDNGEFLGIGWLEDTKLLAMAAVKPGAGERVMNSLMSLIEGSSMTLEVASTNSKAIRLYEKLGFIPVKEVSCWYDVRKI